MRVWLPRPVDRDRELGNTSADAATTAAGGAAATGAKATAEVEAVTDGEPSGQRPNLANWGGHEQGPTGKLAQACKERGEEEG